MMRAFAPLGAAAALLLGGATLALAAPMFPTARDAFGAAYSVQLATRGPFLQAYIWSRSPYLLNGSLSRTDPAGLLVAFPADPPVLDSPLAAPAAVAATPTPGAGDKATAKGTNAAAQASNAGRVPPEYIGYSNEIFYPALTFRLASGLPALQPTPEEKAELTLYKENKLALRAELVAEIDSLRPATAAARADALRKFAGEQTSRVARLETTAQDLRSRLVPREIYFYIQPDALMPPLLGAWPVTALRSAAYFGKRLSVEQRDLLREIALETITRQAGSPAGAPAILVFSPGTARVVVPAHAPAELLDALQKFSKLRSNLQEELALTLGVTEPATRNGGLAALSVKQAPQFVALDNAAEEVRRIWATVSDPAQPPELPHVPAELQARIALYQNEKLQLQRALLARVHEIPAVGQPGAPSADDEQETIRRAVADFTRENSAQYIALNREKEAIRAALGQLAVPTANATGPAADELLQRFSAALQQRDIWRAYFYYRIAVLQPGLSPPQRRLLFDFALEQLLLPVPEAAPPSP